MFVRDYPIGYAKQMRLVISILLLSFMGFALADTVYKTVDEDGNIIFTDKPSENSEEIKLKELQTIKNPNPAKYAPGSKPHEDKGPVYQTFLITSPSNGSALRSNSGNVTISVTLEPPLRAGHLIIVTIDGQEVSNGPASSISLQNQERGTHNISAKVVDGHGKEMISASSSFSLLRASR